MNLILSLQDKIRKMEIEIDNLKENISELKTDIEINEINDDLLNATGGCFSPADPFIGDKYLKKSFSNDSLNTNYINLE